MQSYENVRRRNVLGDAVNISGASKLNADKKAIREEAKRIEKLRKEDAKAARAIKAPRISLPDYTVGEERLNMITHIVGAVFGIFVLIFCVLTAAFNGNTVGIVTSAIYGGSMILLYTMSSIYHGLCKNKAKRVFRVLDHCTIYVLIAGTYTPIALSAMVPVNAFDGWLIFGVEWALAALAIMLTAVDMKKFSVFSMICYIVMGWAVVIVLPTAMSALSFDGFMFILSGGIAYTIGAVLYGVGKKKKYIHGVFHIFSVIASVLQFFGVAFYCL